MCRANRVARFLLCGLLLLNLCPVGISSLAAAEREQAAIPDEFDALSFAYRLGVDQGQSDRTSADGLEFSIPKVPMVVVILGPGAIGTYIIGWNIGKAIAETSGDNDDGGDDESYGPNPNYGEGGDDEGDGEDPEE